MVSFFLVSREQIARVDLVGDLFKFVFEAVGDDDVAALGELCEVVFDLKAIEVAAVGEGWFVYNDFYAFIAEIFNNILDSRRVEVGAIYLFFSAALAMAPNALRSWVLLVPLVYGKYTISTPLSLKYSS